MPLVLCCPYFRGESGLKFNCDACTIQFQTAVDRRRLVYPMCADPTGWMRCPMAAGRYDDYAPSAVKRRGQKVNK